MISMVTNNYHENLLSMKQHLHTICSWQHIPEYLLYLTLAAALPWPTYSLPLDLLTEMPLFLYRSKKYGLAGFCLFRYGQVEISFNIKKPWYHFPFIFVFHKNKTKKHPNI